MSKCEQITNVYQRVHGLPKTYIELYVKDLVADQVWCKLDMEVIREIQQQVYNRISVQVDETVKDMVTTQIYKQYE